MKRLILTAFCVMTVPDHELWGQQGSSEQEGFTLKVVLYGLVALVPHSEGKEMTALLLQTESKGNDGYHEGILATLNGHCKGDCGSQRKRQDSSLLNWRLDEDFKGMKVRISLKVGSDIESTTNLGGESPFRKLCMEQLPRGRPEDVLSEELDWVPCMREAAPEFDRVKLSCLSDNHDPASCPAKARITFDSSLIQRASVCHFAHADDEYGRFTYRKRKAQMFRKGDRRAIGDAVLLEIRVPGPVALKRRGSAPAIRRARMHRKTAWPFYQPTQNWC